MRRMMLAGATLIAFATCATEKKADNPFEGLPPSVSDPTNTLVGWLNLRYADNPGADPGQQSLDLIGPRSLLKNIVERRAAAKAVAKGELAPVAPALTPVFVFIHGGGWVAGHKEDYLGQKAPALAASGMMIASLGYRLAPQWKFPAEIEDVAAAIAWLHDNVARFGGDPDRMIVAGHSAGGHLAALVSTDERWLGAHHLPLTLFKGAVMLDSGSIDLNNLMTGPQEGRAQMMLPEVFGPDLSVLANYSPIRFIAPNKGIPPYLLFFTPSAAREFAEPAVRAFAGALATCGIENEVVPALDKRHVAIHRDFGRPDDWVTRKVLEFCCAKLGLPPPPEQLPALPVPPPETEPH